jgi:hypothetical protein
MGQSPLLGASVKGELLAYDVQFNVLIELGITVSKTSPLRKIHNLLDGHDIDLLTDEQLEYGRKLIKEAFPSFRLYDVIPKSPPKWITSSKPGGSSDTNNYRYLV